MDYVELNFPREPLCPHLLFKLIFNSQQAKTEVSVRKIFNYG
jgi:hypothetical protein